jgi:hypothetical protein
LNALSSCIASLSAALVAFNLERVSSVREPSNLSVAFLIHSFIRFMKFSGHPDRHCSPNTLSSLLKNFSVVAAFLGAQAQKVSE